MTFLGIVCDYSGDYAGGGEGGTVVNSLEKKSKLGKERTRKIKKAVSDWDNGTGDCVDENGTSSKRIGWT